MLDPSMPMPREVDPADRAYVRRLFDVAHGAVPPQVVDRLDAALGLPPDRIRRIAWALDEAGVLTVIPSGDWLLHPADDADPWH